MHANWSSFPYRALYALGRAPVEGSAIFTYPTENRSVRLDVMYIFCLAPHSQLFAADVRAAVIVRESNVRFG
jgi:hypothetical protein